MTRRSSAELDADLPATRRVVTRAVGVDPSGGLAAPSVSEQ
jgi:hypothetical protein